MCWAPLPPGLPLLPRPETRRSPSRRSPSRRSALRLALLRLAAPALRPFVRRAAPRAGPPRLLLLRPDNIGDVLLGAPAVALLEAATPRPEVTYLVGPWARDAATHGPLGERVRALAYPGFARQPKPNALQPYVVLLREALALRRYAFDAAVVLRPDHWWGALLALAAGIPVRVGDATPETSGLLTDPLPTEPALHATHQAGRLVRHLLAVLSLSAPNHQPPPEVLFRTTPEEARAAVAWLATHGLRGTHPVALHPHAGVPLKSWPAARWVALADALAARATPVVLSGGPGEAGLLADLGRRCATPPAALLVDQPLGVVAAVFRHLAAVVGPDSGALHLAAAVGTPTVRLYGPAPPAVFGPYPAAPAQRVLLTDRLPCVPCGHLAAPPCGAERDPPCLVALDVPEVLRALDAVRGSHPGPPT